MNRSLSKDEAIKQLRALCEEAGGVGALAHKIGVHITSLSQQVNGRRPIKGKVARYMGLELEKQITVTYKRIPE